MGCGLLSYGANDAFSAAVGTIICIRARVRVRIRAEARARVRAIGRVLGLGFELGLEKKRRVMA